MVSVKQSKFWLEFIEIYKSVPCLWDVYSKEYSNKILREQALEILIEKCTEINPNADKDFVLKRIANMRTSFSREHKKMNASKTTGSGTDDLYQSNLWYYEHLLFLKDGEATRDGNSSLPLDADRSIDIDCISEDLHSSQSIRSDVSGFLNQPSNSSKKRKNIENSFFEKAVDFISNNSENDEDESVIFGKRIGVHFKNMEPDQRLFAEKIISDVLIYGRLNKLSINSSFNLEPITYECSNMTSRNEHNEMQYCMVEDELSEYINIQQN